MIDSQDPANPGSCPCSSLVFPLPLLKLSGPVFIMTHQQHHTQPHYLECKELLLYTWEISKYLTANRSACYRFRLALLGLKMVVFTHHAFLPWSSHSELQGVRKADCAPSPRRQAGTVFPTLLQHLTLPGAHALESLDTVSSPGNELNSAL